MIQLNEAGPFYAEWFKNEKDLVGILTTEGSTVSQTENGGMDRLLLLITTGGEDRRVREHWMHMDERIHLLRIRQDTLEEWLIRGTNRSAIDWLVRGEIIADPQGYLTNLRTDVLNWSCHLREQQLLCEFSRFAHAYTQAKKDVRNGQVVDAFSRVLDALHYWAHVSLLEQGMHPELTVWEQMRRVNPGIYKLFEELTTSSESMEQRVKLVLLACEFSLLTKMKSSCALLIRTIESRPEPWSPKELMQHPDLLPVSMELSLLLYELTSRGHIREVATASSDRDGARGLIELRYTSALAD